MTSADAIDPYVIVAADDEEMIRDLIRMSLSTDERVELQLAADGSDAVALVREHRPAVVILDVRMPVLGGLEACRLIRDDQSIPQPVIIILSAMGQEGDLVAGKAAGADLYLKEPCSPRELRAEVYELMKLAA